MYKRQVQNQAEISGGEISAENIWKLFNQVYIDQSITGSSSVRLGAFEHKRTTHDLIRAQLIFESKTIQIEGTGHGVMDAFAQALKSYYGIIIDIQEYNEHALQQGSDADAVSYIQVIINHQPYYGVAIHEDTVTASLTAILSACNQYMLESKESIDPFLQAKPA